jgi:hypothetical protein
MIKSMKLTFNNLLEATEFRNKLGKAAEVLKDYPAANFFEELERNFGAKAKDYISATDYYPVTHDKAQGWKMITEHNKNNVELLLHVFKGFCARLILEIKLNNFNSMETSDIYDTLIKLLETEKERIEKLEKQS